MAASSTSRVAGLDVLRAVAIILVLGRHVQFPLTGWSDGAAAAMAVWMQGGWLGVDLFFVLSGFLVSGLLFREYREHGTVSVGRFLVRRALKIYPAFYSFLAVTLAIAVVHWDVGQVSARGLVSELFFLQSYWDGLWWHTWSLAVEEHFYLLCAALVFALTRLGRGAANPYRAVPWVSAFVFAGCLAARLVTADVLPYADRPHAFATHLRIDGLMFGVLLSYAWHFHRATVERVVRGRELVLLAAGVVLMVPAFMVDMRATPFIHTYGFTEFYLASGCVLMAVVVRGVPDVAPFRALARLGAHSYSIYLWHLWVLFEIARLEVVEPRSPVGVAAYLVGSAAIGIGAAKLIELPVLALRDRLFPSRSGPSPVLPTEHAATLAGAAAVAPPG